MHETSLLTYPIAAIDFEATALDSLSFPIEVGVAIVDGPGQPIRTWSSLIKPDYSWDIEAAWDPDAARVHGITRRDLSNGLPPTAVLKQLQLILCSCAAVWCGDEKYDRLWMTVLASAAKQASPAIVLLGASKVLMQPRSADAIDRLAFQRTQAVVHRAGPDAEQLCRMLLSIAAGSDAGSTLTERSA